jgi:para-aminobenzoate synthetase component I
MRPIAQEIETAHSPESLAASLGDAPGVVLLRSGTQDDRHARYSFVTAEPFLTFRSFGSRCEVTLPETRNPKPETRNSSSQTPDPRTESQFGNPWHLLDALMARYELLDELDLPFPLGGCFGCWGYDLKNFVEPRLTRRAVNDLELPDCHVGFYDSLVAFDHRLGKAWIISTGLQPDGSRSEERARARTSHWQGLLSSDPDESESPVPSSVLRPPSSVTSTFTREGFIEAVRRAQHYIRHGHIYQVNLAQRFTAECALTGWEFFQRLAEISPAPFAAYVDGGDFQLASSSPELFLRLSGAHITTRPIKGTRPRSADPTRDAQLTYELTTSPKEMAELVMITDLLRNDLGRVCEFGSVQVPELVRLERYAQVQHLVSTVEGRLRAGVTHFAAFASCFPGGSITGAPKIRAMEIIDELEPVTRGPYTGAVGYLGFNRESQLSIAIRTAVLRDGQAHYHAGAGIVADSSPEAEHEETLAKARGFLAVVEQVTKKKEVREPKLTNQPHNNQ